MTEDDPIAALSGQHQRACSAREVKEERLRDWLARPLWSGAPNPSGPLPWPESTCILAGLDPEASADKDPAGWALLPGALAFYGFDTFPRDRHGPAELSAAVEEHIALLLGLHLKTMKPKRAIAEAKKAKLSIPWYGNTAPKSKMALHAHGSYKARYTKWPKWAEAVADAERLFKAGASNKQITDLLAERDLGIFSQSAVDRWIRKFRDKETAEEMTAEFRRWKEHNGKA